MCVRWTSLSVCVCYVFVHVCVFGWGAVCMFKVKAMQAQINNQGIHISDCCEIRGRCADLAKGLRKCCWRSMRGGCATFVVLFGTDCPNRWVHHLTVNKICGCATRWPRPRFGELASHPYLRHSNSPRLDGISFHGWRTFGDLPPTSHLRATQPTIS